MYNNYKEQYCEIFNKDFDFNKEYSKDANKIILQELAIIIDYEAKTTGQPHPMDLEGYDRQINVTFGFGVRTRKINDVRFAEFTVDLKEWKHQINDPHYYYFYAFAQKPPMPHKINFWLLLDYRQLKKLVNQDKIKPSVNQNRKHSLVNFYGFKILELFTHNLIIAYDGDPEVINQIGLPQTKNKRVDRQGVTY